MRFAPIQKLLNILNELKDSYLMHASADFARFFRNLSQRLTPEHNRQIVLIT